MDAFLDIVKGIRKMIYLVQVNYSGYHAMNVVPLALLAIGSVLKKTGYDVKIVHCTENQIDQYVNEIIQANPLYTAFSVITGPQAFFSAVMSENIKKESPHIPIIWGGIHPSLLPKQCLQEEYIDYVVIGEGEDTIVELTRNIEYRKDLGDVKGIGYKHNGTIRLNPMRPFIKNLDDEKYRFEFELLEIPKYFRKVAYFTGNKNDRAPQRVFAYQTSRGCPFNCAFCYNQRFNRRRWRAMSPQRVIEDINYLKKTYGIDGVMFYDDEFFINKKRALDILYGISLPAKTDIRIDMITDELAARLKELQVFSMLIGIESGSNRVLKLMNKGFTVDRIKKGVEILAKYNIRASYSAIIGLPTEAEEEMSQTIDLILWIQRVHKNSAFTVGPYLPYPGSDMYYLAIEHGFVPPNDTKGWGKIDRWISDPCLPWVPDDRIFRIREYMNFLNYNVPFLSKISEFRLKHRWLTVPMDLKIINFLHEHSIEANTFFGKSVRKLHRFLRVLE